MLTYLYVHPLRRTQVSRHGTGSFIPSGTQMPTEGTGVKTPTTYRRKPMAKVTYRGVIYDTDRNRGQQTKKVDLTYRGVSQKKELTSVK